ncbi:MAG: sensor histidine kinase [Eggerthellaceae bacterium]
MQQRRFLDAARPAEEDALRASDWVDAGIALIAFLFGCGQLFLASTSVIYVDGPFREMAGLVNIVPNMYAYGALAFTTLPLVLRRVAPWPTLAIVLACFFFSSGYMSGFALSAIGPMVAVCSLSYLLDRRHAVVAGLLTATVMLLAPTPLPSETLATVMRTQNLIFVVAAALAGFALRTYRAYMAETHRRLEEAERSREELAARRVAEERVRIARDVHDITAHSLSAVAIQAAAAERLVDSDPAAAKSHCGYSPRVEGALDEIRSMIGVLRGTKSRDRPSEGTERLADVVEYLRRASGGYVRNEGYRRKTFPLSWIWRCFSLVREAATNTVRHAQANSVDILLRSTATQASPGLFR